MNQSLTRGALREILQTENIEALSFSQLTRLFEEEKGAADFIPDGLCQIDPRNGKRIIFNSARARRPHDNRPSDQATEQSAKPCIICQGKTTGVVDVADLSEGFTFINKNLFSVFHPANAPKTKNPPPPVDRDPGPAGMTSYGLHFLQWTSSHHDKDWHNMPLPDRIVVMERLAALEKKLLTGASELMPATQILDGQEGRYGFVSIIKNYGRLVGGSLAHGHQQIGFSNIIPRRIRDNWRFEQIRGEPFSAYLLHENPAEYLIRDYGSAVLLTPYFMRRPFDMMLLLKDAGKQYLHELTGAELSAVAEGWRDAIRAILQIMPQIGRETAYNVVANNGPGAGLYFEFLPYTQEFGGFEHLGLFLCQENPQNAAARVRELLD